MSLVNGVTAHVLFDLGVTRSFVSLTLSKKFGYAQGPLDYPLEVEIVDDCIVSALVVHHGYILELFYERYMIDLVPIALRGMKIIMGMD